jgi:hypothetical protein
MESPDSSVLKTRRAFQSEIVISKALLWWSQSNQQDSKVQKAGDDFACAFIVTVKCIPNLET